MRLISIIILALAISGCEKSSEDIAKGKLRHALFVECMGLAAKMPRQSDDDVSDIVEECSHQSYYMSNGMSK